MKLQKNIAESAFEDFKLHYENVDFKEFIQLVANGEAQLAQIDKEADSGVILERDLTEKEEIELHAGACYRNAVMLLEDDDNEPYDFGDLSDLENENESDFIDTLNDSQLEDHFKSITSDWSQETESESESNGSNTESKDSEDENSQ